MSVLVVAALALFACNDTANNKGAGAEEQVPAETKAPRSGSEALVTLHAGDDMKFDLTEIRVQEGQTVTLILRHTGKLTKQAMGHNFVLLAKNVSASDFASAALHAAETDYVPPQSKEVIAHTKLLAGGESDTITFFAPEKGVYEFLCSFPGHVSLMKGKFIVE